jgi:serine/threonine-protein kinase
MKREADIDIMETADAKPAADASQEMSGELKASRSSRSSSGTLQVCSREPSPTPPERPGVMPDSVSFERIVSEAPPLGSSSNLSTTHDADTVVYSRRADSPKVIHNTSRQKCAPAGKRRFGKFELLIEMGQGGMASLFLARISGPQKFQKLLAIKKIHDHLATDRRFVQMFLDEARIAALIQHPNVATIFDLGQIDSSYFIAMEYVHGASLVEVLKSCIRQNIEFPWSYAAWIVAQAASGLDAAHDLKNPEGKPLEVVHRDVSPQNILISYEGHVKVVDFGIAFAAEKLFHTETDVLKGKVSYVAPEQTWGQGVDRRSDIFSLGIVLFEAVCLKRLFREKSDAATIKRVSKADVPRPRSIRPDIPADLERIMLRALARNPDNRYASAGMMADAIEEVLAYRGETVNPRKVAAFLNHLLHDRKRIQEQQILTAIEGSGEHMLKDIVASADSHIEDFMEPARPTTTFRKKIAVGIGAGAFMLTLVVAGLFGFLWMGSTGERLDRTLGAVARRSPEPATGTRLVIEAVPESNEGDSQKKKEPIAEDDVKVSVDIEPRVKGSRVLFRGIWYSGSDFTSVIRKSRKPERLTVRAPGYLEQHLVIVPTEDTSVLLKLVPAPADEQEKRTRRSRARRSRKTSRTDLLRGLPE